MNEVLLDTGVIVALLDRRERYHPQSVERMRNVSGQLVTCEAVIAEACHLLRTFRGAPQDVLAHVTDGTFQIPFRLGNRAANVSRLMTKYADTPMDFADACIVDLAGELNTGRILTLNSDFQTYRWGRNRKFELLIDL